MSNHDQLLKSAQKWGRFCNNSIYGGDCYGETSCACRKNPHDHPRHPHDHKDIYCNVCDCTICGCCFELTFQEKCPMCGRSRARIMGEEYDCDVCGIAICCGSNTKYCESCDNIMCQDCLEYALDGGCLDCQNI